MRHESLSNLLGSDIIVISEKGTLICANQYHHGKRGRVMLIVVKYVHYKHTYVYALYYRSNNTLYYNLLFSGKCKLIIFS